MLKFWPYPQANHLLEAAQRKRNLEIRPKAVPALWEEDEKRLAGEDLLLAKLQVAGGLCTDGKANNSFGVHRAAL